MASVSSIGPRTFLLRHIDRVQFYRCTMNRNVKDPKDYRGISQRKGLETTQNSFKHAKLNLSDFAEQIRRTAENCHSYRESGASIEHRHPLCILGWSYARYGMVFNGDYFLCVSFLAIVNVVMCTHKL